MKVRVVAIIFALFLLAVLLAGGAECAIAENDTSAVQATVGAAGPDTLYWESVVSSGSDRYLVVDLCALGSGQVIDSVFYGDQVMTAIDTAIVSLWHAWSYGLVAPAIGTDTIWAFFNAATSNMHWTGLAISYTGVDQSTPYYAVYDTIHAYHNTLSLNSGTSAWGGVDESDWIHVFFGSRLAQGGFTPGASQTDHVERLLIPAAVAGYKVGVAGADAVSYAVAPNNPEDISLIVFGLNTAAAGNVTVSPDEAISAATAINPTIPGLPVTVSPDEAIADATAVDPTVVLSGGTSDRVFYISPPDSGGNNSTGDGSRGSPWATVLYVVDNHLHDGWGDTLMLMEGTYPGQGRVGFSTRMGGHPDTYLTIMADPLSATMPIIDANKLTNSALSFTARYTEPSNNNPDDDLAYIKIKGIDFRNPIYHCTNFDDGGTPDMAHDSRGTPAHHVIFEDCRYSGAGDGYGGIKISGLDTFLIDNCHFQDIRGPHLDVVGCHVGTISDCVFYGPPYSYVVDTGGSLTIKGGSSRILVTKCYVKGTGFGGLYMGQTTGKLYFRPPLMTNDWEGIPCDYEVKNIDFYCNIIDQVKTPTMFSHNRGGKVYNNTIYAPVGWYANQSTPTAIYCISRFRYMQDGSIAPDTLVWTRGTHFMNNICYFGTPGRSYNSPFQYQTIYAQNSDVNMESFYYSHNLWYCPDDTSESMPPWSWYETQNGSPGHGVNHTGNPSFVEASPDTFLDFRIQTSGEAASAGSTYTNVIYDWWAGEYVDDTDFFGDAWDNPMSIGAIAADGDVSVSPDAAIAEATAADPIVLIAGNELIAPDAAIAAATATDPTVEHGGLTIAPDAALASATATDPNVYSGEVTPPETYPALGHYRRRRHL